MAEAVETLASVTEWPVVIPGLRLGMTRMTHDEELIDAVGPWTIKSVSVETRNKVTIAARKEGLTVGQWLERRVASGWRTAARCASAKVSLGPK